MLVALPRQSCHSLFLTGHTLLHPCRSLVRGSQMDLQDNSKKKAHKKKKNKPPFPAPYTARNAPQKQKSITQVWILKEQHKNVKDALQEESIEFHQGEDALPCPDSYTAVEDHDLEQLTTPEDNGAESANALEHCDMDPALTMEMDCAKDDVQIVPPVDTLNREGSAASAKVDLKNNNKKQLQKEEKNTVLCPAPHATKSSSQNMKACAQVWVKKEQKEASPVMWDEDTQPTKSEGNEIEPAAVLEENDMGLALPTELDSLTEYAKEAAPVAEFLENEEFTASVKVDVPLLRFLTGKGLKTKVRIEKDTETKIFVPSSKEVKCGSCVVVKGHSQYDVDEAVVQIQNVLQEAVTSARLDYSHFISLPLALHPMLKGKMKQFRDSVLNMFLTRSMETKTIHEEPISSKVENLMDDSVEMDDISATCSVAKVIEIDHATNDQVETGAPKMVETNDLVVEIDRATNDQVETGAPKMVETNDEVVGIDHVTDDQVETDAPKMVEIDVLANDLVHVNAVKMESPSGGTVETNELDEQQENKSDLGSLTDGSMHVNEATNVFVEVDAATMESSTLCDLEINEIANDLVEIDAVMMKTIHATSSTNELTNDSAEVSATLSKIDVAEIEERRNEYEENKDSFDNDGDDVEEQNDDTQLLMDAGPKACHGVEESIFIKPETLHLTVLMLKLWSKERVAAAAEVLQGLKPKLDEVLGNKPVAVQLKGMECMRGYHAKAHVLYVKVEEVDEGSRLLEACELIIDAFAEAGLVLERDKKQKLLLHATLMNTSHRKRTKGRQHGRRIPFDAREILSRYAEEDWGKHQILEVHLSERFSYDENGYYHCCTSIPFPAAE